MRVVNALAPGSITVGRRIADLSGIKLFVLPPRSPKLNGQVERANRTHTEEFYEVTDCDFELAPLNLELRRWEFTYNTIRPHQALGYLTPHEFLMQNYSINGKKKVYGLLN